MSPEYPDHHPGFSNYQGRHWLPRVIGVVSASPGINRLSVRCPGCIRIGVGRCGGIRFIAGWLLCLRRISVSRFCCISLICHLSSQTRGESTVRLPYADKEFLVACIVAACVQLCLRYDLIADLDCFVCFDNESIGTVLTFSLSPQEASDRPHISSRMVYGSGSLY